MGQPQSMPPEQRLAMLDVLSGGLFASDEWQGIEIDSSLLSYSGLNSYDVLDSYRDQVFDVPGAIEKLGAALAGFKAVPNAVGLGALIISMILESVGKSLGKQTMGTAEMLQRVFAEEKGNEVRDLMEEYLKRLRINLGKPQLQLAETRQIERDLSAQLTRLKNSMMVDGHMDSRLLKQWVNGAAFHTQMLIHQARLEGADGSRAVQAAGIYQRQLNDTMHRFKYYMIGNTLIERCDGFWVYCCLYFRKWEYFNYPTTEALKEYVECVTETEVIEHLFSKQISWTKSYFSDLAANIPTLVRQNATFQIQNRH
ncbi:Pof6 interactor protein 1 [Dissostichus eleginoides]|uniref:Pof6 interactor protein 1 n=1 Tax=Dissostichus eleginoides TaxID=100907 RepID=A0AAD9BHD4_DISEL|nr:Pof6 interactor protein 1 [Dissostichus eleginoides]